MSVVHQDLHLPLTQGEGDEHGWSLQPSYWQCESDVQLYAAWAESTSEAAKKMQRATHDTVDLLQPGGLFTLILVLPSPCVHDTEAMKFEHNPRFLVAPVINSFQQEQTRILIKNIIESVHLYRENIYV